MRRVIAVTASVLLMLAALGPSALAQDDDALAGRGAPPARVLERMAMLGEHPLVGAWVVDPEPDDPNNPLNLSTFSADGTMRDASEGPGAGAWAPTGERSADVTIRYSAFDPEAGFLGLVTVRAAVAVSADGRTFAGTYTVEFPTGPEGEAVGPFPGAGEFGPAEVTAERIAVEPMGEPVGPLPALHEGPPPAE